MPERAVTETAVIAEFGQTIVSIDVAVGETFEGDGHDFEMRHQRELYVIK